MGRSVIPLKQRIIYGPVRSRRLGSSLGINLLLHTEKYCSLECLYCQYGHTRIHSLSLDDARRLPTPAEVEQALVEALEVCDPAPAFLTLSGNGEPTLHPAIGEIVTRIRAARDRLAPAARTAILSNSTTCMVDGVRRALALLDVRIMKLDAGTAAVFEHFNRPCPGVELDRIVDGLSSMPDVTIQAMMAGGPDGNYTPENTEAWVDCLKKIRPAAVQIYSLDRGTLSRDLDPIPRDELERLAARLRRLGMAVTAY